MFTQIAIEQLQKKGYKLTQSRLDLIEYFENTKKILSPYDIQKNKNTLDIVSIYRTLELFESLGLIHKILSLNAYVKCAISHCSKTTKCCHEFQICTQCNECCEVHGHHSHSISTNGFVLQSHISEQLGICANCNQ